MEHTKRHTYSAAIVHFIILLAAILLSWKLFRFMEGGKIFWLLHVYVLVVLVAISSLMFINNNRFFMVSKTSMIVFLFLVFVLLRSIVFPNADPFLIATFSFGLFFLLYYSFSSTAEDAFFDNFELLLKLLLLINLLDFVDGNFLKIGIFPYENISNYFGELNPTIYETKSFVSELGILPVVRRTIGISGTPYASSALTAATGIYFLIAKKRILFWFCVLFLFLWGVGSTFLSMMLIAILAGLKKRFLPFALILIVPMILIAIDVRGMDPAVLLHFKNNFSLPELFLAGVIGEGKQISSMASELRIVGTFFSLGIVGAVLATMIFINYYKSMRINKESAFYRKYKAGFLFIITLLLSSFHYDTFFIFPNIIIVVTLISFVSSRQYFYINHVATLTMRLKVKKI